MINSFVITQQKTKKVDKFSLVSRS